MDYNLSTGHSHPCGYAVLWNKKKFSNKLINLHIFWKKLSGYHLKGTEYSSCQL